MKSKTTWIEEYFNELLGIHQLISAARGQQQYDYCIGSRNVKVEVAGTILNKRITPVLEHLRCANHHPAELTIKVFDQYETHIEFPKFPEILVQRASHFKETHHTALEPVHYYDDENFRLSWHDGSLGYELNILHKKQDVALVYFKDTQATHDIDCIHAAPFRTIFSWWFFIRHHIILVHAGSVGLPEGGVLFCGKGGSGKSITSFACVEGGLQYMGDDSVLIKTGSPHTVYSLYQAGGLCLGDMTKYPFLMNRSCPHASYKSSKNLFLIHENTHASEPYQYPLRAVIIPKLSSTHDCRMFATSSANALRALAPSSLYQFSGDAPEKLRQMSQLLGSVPAYIIEIGTEHRQIPQLVKSILHNENRKIESA